MVNGWGGRRENCGRRGKSRFQKELEGEIPMSNNNVPEVIDKVDDIPSDDYREEPYKLKMFKEMSILQ